MTRIDLEWARQWLENAKAEHDEGDYDAMDHWIALGELAVQMAQAEQLKRIADMLRNVTEGHGSINTYETREI
jgi:hypothetical protein